MQVEQPYRYPGVAPFSKEQQHIFFGRELEVQRLLQLVSTEQQVLLYAKSGLGKSSLINAGLIPKLAAQPETILLTIRVGAYHGPSSPSPLSSFHAALPVSEPSFLDSLIPQEGSLWQRCKEMELRSIGPLRFFIIFDQFEELFTHPEAEIFAFKKQMADLLYRVVPKHFRAVLEIKQRQTPDLLSEDELRLLNQPMDLHVLYAIREDRYSALNRLADYLPDILHTRFQLSPLTRANAEQAIQLPAQSGGDFATPPYEYNPDALQRILDYLTKGRKEEVETTQLQILCSRLELLRKPEIRAEDIPAFDDIFLEFYYESIQCLPESSQNNAQAFIEEELIKSGQRIALDRLACLEFLDATSLDTLLRDRHLIRAEQNSIGGISFELSHDSMVAPVLQARAVREAKLAEAARLAEEERLRHQLEVEQAERQKERRQLRRTRMALLLAIIGASIAMAAVFYATRQKSLANEMAEKEKAAADEAKRQMAEANHHKTVALQAYQQLQKAITENTALEVKNLLDRAWTSKMANEKGIAIELLNKAFRLDSTSDTIRRLLNEWK